MRPMHLAAALAALALQPGARAQNPYSEAALLKSPGLGPHVHLTAAQAGEARGFTGRQAFVGTYYFFWYDDEKGEHFANPDGSDALVHHPVEKKGYSYKRVEWHRKELLDTMDAGIDFIMPVYWGAPPDKVGNFPWHHLGLTPLVKAEEALIAEGRKPPKIGMFYDTSSLSESGNIAHNAVDLTTPDGKAWFYVTIRDFFSLIPPKLWATLDGRPIVFLYGSGYAKAGADDAKLFDYVREHFAADFGGVKPYLVAERSWQVPADSTYDWGAAFSPKACGVATLGPGYDDRAVPGRTSPVIDRKDGALYRERWERLLTMDPATRPQMAVIETWNELHEGTDICETREFGRKYIDLTKRYAADWRAGKRLPSASPYANARSATVTFGPNGRDRGVRLVANADGLFRQSSAVGSDCVETTPNAANGEQFLYFDVDDGFYFEPAGPVTVAIEFLDEGGGAIGLTYDSADVRAQMAGSYKSAGEVARGDSGAWKVAEFHLKDARFCNRENSFTDFRISAGGKTLKVRRVTITKEQR